MATPPPYTDSELTSLITNITTLERDMVLTVVCSASKEAYTVEIIARVNRFVLSPHLSHERTFITAQSHRCQPSLIASGYCH